MAKPIDLLELLDVQMVEALDSKSQADERVLKIMETAEAIVEW